MLGPLGLTVGPLGDTEYPAAEGSGVGSVVGTVAGEDVGHKDGVAVGLLVGPLGARVGDGVMTLPPAMAMVPPQANVL